jgi:flagellar basal body-associated protein FliL
MAKHAKDSDDDPCPCAAEKSADPKKREGSSRIALVTAVVTLLGAILTLFGVVIKARESPSIDVAPSAPPAPNLPISLVPTPEISLKGETQPNSTHFAAPPTTTTTNSAHGQTTEPREPPATTTTTTSTSTTSETQTTTEPPTPSDPPTTTPTDPPLAFASPSFDGLESIGSAVYAHMVGDTPPEPQESAEAPQEPAEAVDHPV